MWIVVCIQAVVLVALVLHSLILRGYYVTLGLKVLELQRIIEQHERGLALCSHELFPEDE